MKKINSGRNYLLTALLIGGIFMTGALSSVNAQTDNGTFGGGAGRDNGGFLGSGNRGDGGLIGSGTLTDGGGMIGSGTLSNQMGSSTGFTDDGGFLGSGIGAASSLASVWEIFF